MKAKLITIVVILALVLIYTLQNTEAVTISFVSWDFSASKALLSLGAFLAGVILGFILGKVDTRKAKKDRWEVD
ncbi:MAG: hypothetical protein DRG31_02455 [Deltaproteobacteria bacterium]|nr:MAG: hypothetical protein DRG31_02455 [Deltaproteobacteria bacterium]